MWCLEVIKEMNKPKPKSKEEDKKKKEETCKKCEPEK